MSRHFHFKLLKSSKILNDNVWTDRALSAYYIMKLYDCFYFISLRYSSLYINFGNSLYFTYQLWTELEEGYQELQCLGGNQGVRGWNGCLLHTHASLQHGLTLTAGTVNTACTQKRQAINTLIIHMCICPPFWNISFLVKSSPNNPEMRNTI